MEFLKTVRKKSFLNEAIYVALNIGLALALALIIITTNSLLFAFLLVLVSKWRIFAVRPRFWFANLQANLVSIIVSVSYVIFLYTVNNSSFSEDQILMLQGLLVFMDVLWLLLLKPQSKRMFVAFQAGVALFAGISALFIVSYNWIATPVVLLVWLIGYATARHVLGSYDDESHGLVLSLAWGFVLSEISWVAYHWTTAYRIPIIANIHVPQVSIIVLCLGFVTYKAYNSYYHHQKIRMNDIILPLVFSVSIIALLVFAFNSASSAI